MSRCPFSGVELRSFSFNSAGRIRVFKWSTFLPERPAVETRCGELVFMICRIN